MNAAWEQATKYETGDEAQFLRELHAKNQNAFVQYAALVTSGMRSYDKWVDVAIVRRVIRELREGRG